MTEILYDYKNCELWEKTKVLAQERNLQMSNTCPIVSVCKGTRCVFLNGETDQQKLAKLREELKGYGKKI